MDTATTPNTTEAIAQLVASCKKVLRSKKSTPQQTAEAAQYLLKLALIANKGKARAGYYAVNVSGEMKRYILDAPATGKWAGWQFLKTGSDYNNRKRLLCIRPDGRIPQGNHGNASHAHAVEIYTAIIADPVQAMLNYSAITGVCGACGRKLEDSASVAIGIGPICLGKMF